jgi:ABC-2 type transport system ATP-binding protein
VEVLAAEEGHTRLRVRGEADLTALVGGVTREADVVSFSYQPPTLSELFREAVSR